MIYHPLVVLASVLQEWRPRHSAAPAAPFVPQRPWQGFARQGRAAPAAPLGI